MARVKKKLSLEEMLQQIEETIQDMERPDMTLEETFRAYESGLKMIKEANNKIDLVEKEMIILQQELTDEVEE